MKKVLIVGRGLLGTFLAKHLPHDVTLCSHEEWQRLWDCDDFDVLINCAAIVGQGKCERAGYDAVMEANVYLPNLFVKLFGSARNMRCFFQRKVFIKIDLMLENGCLRMRP